MNIMKKTEETACRAKHSNAASTPTERNTVNKNDALREQRLERLVLEYVDAEFDNRNRQYADTPFDLFLNEVIDRLDLFSNLCDATYKVDKWAHFIHSSFKNQIEQDLQGNYPVVAVIEAMNEITSLLILISRYSQVIHNMADTYRKLNSEMDYAVENDFEITH
jgi:hypothetical protein